MSVQPISVLAPGVATSDDDFIFSLQALGLFFVCAFAGLLLAYGVAAPTGVFICVRRDALLGKPTQGLTGAHMCRVAATTKCWGVALEAATPCSPKP